MSLQARTVYRIHPLQRGLESYTMLAMNTPANPSAQAPKSAQQWREAIDALTARNRDQRSDTVEQQLADYRIRAAADITRVSTSAAAELPGSTLFPDLAMGHIPEITRDELQLDRLASGILHHGAVIVRGLLPGELSEQLRNGIDAALLDQREASAARDESNEHWFNPPESLLQHPLCKGRDFVTRTGGMWAADSPRMLYLLLEEYERLGLRDILDRYFGEPAWLSIKKWVLRRVSPLQQPSDWHQDGAFMGADVKSVNLWISLSDCGGGRDAPGMDIVPTRLNHIVETGSHGAVFDWSVGSDLVTAEFAATPPVQPHFGIGDAIFFDHFNLHRTSFSPQYHLPRYAVECWFLGRSNYPARQVPLYW